MASVTIVCVCFRCMFPEFRQLSLRAVTAAWPGRQPARMDRWTHLLEDEEPQRPQPVRHAGAEAELQCALPRPGLVL